MKSESNLTTIYRDKAIMLLINFVWFLMIANLTSDIHPGIGMIKYLPNPMVIFIFMIYSDMNNSKTVKFCCDVYNYNV